MKYNNDNKTFSINHYVEIPISSWFNLLDNLDDNYACISKSDGQFTGGVCITILKCNKTGSIFELSEYKDFIYSIEEQHTIEIPTETYHIENGE